MIFLQIKKLILLQKFAREWALLTLVEMERLQNLIENVEVTLNTMLVDYA